MSERIAAPFPDFADNVNGRGVKILHAIFRMAAFREPDCLSEQFLGRRERHQWTYWSRLWRGENDPR